VGLQTFVDLLEFVASLVVSEGEGVHTDLDALGLELANAALCAGRGAFARHPALLALTRQVAPLAFC
jgi:hypothetical protein